MWLIWYRILYPYTIGVIMLLIILIYLYRKNKKIQNKIKKKRYQDQYRRRKALSVFLLCVLGSIVLYTGYLSLDLIRNDPITCEATFLRQYRGRDNTWDVTFQDDKGQIQVNVWWSEVRQYNFQPNHIYRITYSRRTCMLLSAEKKAGDRWESFSLSKGGEQIWAFIPKLFPILLVIVTAIRIKLFFFISKISYQRAEKDLSAEHITIRLHPIYLWSGSINILFFIICIFVTILFLDGTAAIWGLLVSILFLLLGIYMVLKRQVWKIEIFRNEDYFLYRTFPYKTYRILYTDCVNYESRADILLFGTTLILRTKGKKLRVKDCAINFEFLLSMLKKHKVAEIK